MDKCILVSIDPDDFSIDELENLAKTAAFETVCKIKQNIVIPNKKYYIGSGKVKEIKNACNIYNASLVIFDDELSPIQLKNLEKALEIKVIDRSFLILNIFERRAKTKQAILEIKLAQLKYSLPRLIGLNNSLSRQGGGINAKGPGETKLELDRRLIELQITKIKRDLEKINKENDIRRNKRLNKDIKTVALIGYTNAGKSALMNTLIKKSSSSKIVLEEDILFSTIDTYVRKIKNNLNQEFLLVDTVGFVSKLPHHLINSFKATLKETLDADLLIHVVDASNANFDKQIEVTNEVIKTLDSSQIPMIYAFNKSDKLNKQFFPNYPDSILISSLTGDNIDLLLSRITDKLFNNYRKTINLAHKDGKLLSYLETHAKIISKNYNENGIILDVIINNETYKKINGFIDK